MKKWHDRTKGEWQWLEKGTFNKEKCEKNERKDRKLGRRKEGKNKVNRKKERD